MNMTETINLCSSSNAKKAISFYPQVRVIHTAHLNTYSSKEIRACWYRSAELKLIRQEVDCTVDLMEENDEINESRHCTRGLERFTQEGYCKRGLERFTQEGSRRKTQNKLKAWSAVFEEQELQSLQEVVDPEMIAVVYSKATRGCQVAAYIMGVCNEWSARSQYAFPPEKQAATMKTPDRFFVPPTSRTIPLAPRQFTLMA
jgi:hypothetical protein